MLRIGLLAAIVIGSSSACAHAQPSVDMGPAQKGVGPRTSPARPATTTGPGARLPSTRTSSRLGPVERPAAPPASVPQTQLSPRETLQQMIDRRTDEQARIADFQMTYEIPPDATILSSGGGITNYRLPNGIHGSVVSSSVSGGLLGAGSMYGFPDYRFLAFAAGGWDPSRYFEFRSYREWRACGEGGPDDARGGFLSEPVNVADLIPASYSKFMEGPTTEQSTDLTKADAALAAGRASEAAALYEAHLKQNADEALGAMVRHGLALIESGRVSEGIAVVYQAYESDHGLADNSLRLAIPEWSEHRIRTMVSRVVGHANRNQSASSWLVVALLMEAEGRASLANQMLDRSVGFGLDQSLGMRVRGMIACSMPKKR